jgi:hypothetical protein
MMRTSGYNIPSVTPQCTTIELVDDDVTYAPTAYQHENLPSELLCTGEPHGVSNVDRFSDAQHDSDSFQVTLELTPFKNFKKADEEIPMNSVNRTLRIDIFCRPILMIIALVIFGFISAAPVAAQLDPTTADFVEWDLPSLKGAGACPSSIGAVTLPPTGDPVYYVTFGACPSISPNNPGREGPVMVRFIPGTPLATGTATWRAWNLGGLIQFTGGMKITRNERVAFVRTQREIIRVNMTTNVLTHWLDFPDNADAGWSDLALVERSGGYYIDVYTAHNDPVNQGIIQRLTVENGGTTGKVKRWIVDGGAGAEFLSGVAYFSGNGKIYFSEGVSNKIGELDPSTNKVRRWDLSEVDPLVASPRQISIDTKGVVWVVTASGHLVSLNPCNNQMAAYIIPGAGVPASPGPAAQPFGVATSGGVVAFTESEGKKVGMLIPNKHTVDVTPSCVTALVTYDSIPGTTECINPDYGTVMPQSKPGQPAVHTDIDPLGEFVEATLPDTGNFPLGIFRDVERSVGNFWAVVMLGGTNINGADHRLSHVAFPTGKLTEAGLVTGGGTLSNVIDDLDLGGDDDDWDSDSDSDGGGFGGGGGAFSNFGFNVYRKNVTSPVRGQLNYHNKTTGEHIKSVTIGTLTISGNTATFSGTCTNNGLPCTFTVTVQDNGNPGRGKDTFHISGFGVTPNGGTLSGGNIKFHRQH